MKKTYINPELVVVKIQTQQMLASSPTGLNEEIGGGTQLSREEDFFFEEE